jgi:hypothetical protein
MTTEVVERVNPKVHIMAKGELVESTEETDKLVEQVRQYYRNVQKTWFYFAKALKEIRDTEAFRAYDTASFKDFCVKEFPSLNYTTIIKTIKVVENFGHIIEEKLNKDPNYTLPAYESCYQLVNIEDKIPKKKHKELTLKIFDGKLSFHRFRNEVKTIIDTERAKARVGVTEEDLEKELLTDISTDGMDEIEEEVSDVATGESIDKIVTLMEVRLNYLKDNLPLVTQNIQTDEELITDEVIEFANELNEFSEKSNEFLKLMASLV